MSKLEGDGIEAVKNTFDTFLEKMRDPELLVEPQELNPIPNTDDLFYYGGYHLIYGLAKEGKTYFTLTILNKVKEDVIWLDGDLNDKKMADKFKNIIHLPPKNANSYLDMWIKEDIDLTGKIFVIDSLKDFNNDLDIDKNSTSDKALKRIKQLKAKGATVIVIHHATERFDNGGKFIGAKLKGNAESIYGNVDITYRFSRSMDESKSTMYVDRSRVEGVPNGEAFEFSGVGVTRTTKSKEQKNDVGKRV